MVYGRDMGFFSYCWVYGLLRGSYLSVVRLWIRIIFGVGAKKTGVGLRGIEGGFY